MFFVLVTKYVAKLRKIESRYNTLPEENLTKCRFLFDAENLHLWRQSYSPNKSECAINVYSFQFELSK